MSTNPTTDRSVTSGSRYPASERYSLSEYDEVESISLPREQIRSKTSFAFVIERLAAWPGQRFAVEFTWNNPDQRWYWRMKHLAQRVTGGPTRGRNIETLEGTDMFRAPAVLDRPYEYRDLLLFVFADPSGQADRVDHRTLQSSVYLDVYPGPESPAFPFDLDLPEDDNPEDVRPYLGYE